MPIRSAASRVWVRPDLPKPELSDSRASLDKPRFFISCMTFSAAMRSVCAVLNTHFFTGSMITTAPASEINGVPAPSISLTLAMVVAVVEPPTITSTRSLLSNRLVNDRALSARPPSS